MGICVLADDVFHNVSTRVRIDYIPKSGLAKKLHIEIPNEEEEVMRHPIFVSKFVIDIATLASEIKAHGVFTQLMDISDHSNQLLTIKESFIG